MAQERTARVIEGTLRGGRIVELDQDLGAGTRRITLVVLEEHRSDERAEGEAPKDPPNLLALRGLGAEVWQGVDAQEYVNELRREWDERDERSDPRR